MDLNLSHLSCYLNTWFSENKGLEFKFKYRENGGNRIWNHFAFLKPMLLITSLCLSVSLKLWDPWQGYFFPTVYKNAQRYLNLEPFLRSVPFSDSMTTKQPFDNLAPSVVFLQDESQLVMSIWHLVQMTDFFLSVNQYTAILLYIDLWELGL